MHDDPSALHHVRPLHNHYHKDSGTTASITKSAPSLAFNIPSLVSRYIFTGMLYNYIPRTIIRIIPILSCITPSKLVRTTKIEILLHPLFFPIKNRRSRRIGKSKQGAFGAHYSLHYADSNRPGGGGVEQKDSIKRPIIPEILILSQSHSYLCRYKYAAKKHNIELLHSFPSHTHIQRISFVWRLLPEIDCMIGENLRKLF